MKNKIFDFRLYLQGLGRLRVIGIALAILCLTISVLVPTVRWLDGPGPNYQVEYPLDGDELVLEGSAQTWHDFDGLTENGKWEATWVQEAISDEVTIIPVLVASYLSPVLMLMMFSFLNKRKESDFYHAIPFTRGCVYTSFVAAVLTWVWGVLIFSSLSAALVWALCPYVTFSFGGLIGKLLLACLNAALLSAFAAVAVSLTGTSSTAIITSLLVTWIWRIVMLFTLLCLECVLFLTPVDTIWGGYFSLEFWLPVTLITGGNRPVVIIYAVLVTLALFALGGVLYSKRRSELAGRSVPGRFVHNLLRCMMTLPIALLLIYQIIDGNDFTTILIIFVCMLLVFYLYELLTTKSARRMFRATPWLGAVVGVCVVFFGIILLSGYVEEHERTDADRIQSVEIMNVGNVVSDSVVINSYEMSQIGPTDDADIIATVADAWERTQTNPRGAGALYGKRLVVHMKLKGGRRIIRELNFPWEDYYSMMGELKENANPQPIPSDEMIKKLQISPYSMYNTTKNIRVSGEWRTRLMQAMRTDYANMTQEQRKGLIDYSGREMLRFYITTEINGKTAMYSYSIQESMPNTIRLLYEIYGLPTYGRAKAAKSLIQSWGQDQRNTITIVSENGHYQQNRLATSNEKDLNQVKNILLKAIDRAQNESQEGYGVLIYINGWEEDIGIPAMIIVPARLYASEWKIIDELLFSK